MKFTAEKQKEKMKKQKDAPAKIQEHIDWFSIFPYKIKW